MKDTAGMYSMAFTNGPKLVYVRSDRVVVGKEIVEILDKFAHVFEDSSEILHAAVTRHTGAENFMKS